MGVWVAKGRHLAVLPVVFEESAAVVSVASIDRVVCRLAVAHGDRNMDPGLVQRVMGHRSAPLHVPVRGTVGVRVRVRLRVRVKVRVKVRVRIGCTYAAW